MAFEEIPSRSSSTASCASPFSMRFATSGLSARTLSPELQPKVRLSHPLQNEGRPNPDLQRYTRVRHKVG